MDDVIVSFVEVRGKRYRREMPDVVRRWHPHASAAPTTGSRWTTSVSTFGPLGRIVITAVCAAPVLLLLLPFLWPGASLSLGTALFLFLLVVGTSPFAVWVLRDVWRRGGR